MPLPMLEWGTLVDFGAMLGFLLFVVTTVASNSLIVPYNRKSMESQRSEPSTRSASKANTPDSYCQSRWEDALQICQELLTEEDYQAILECENCEKLLENNNMRRSAYADKTIPRLLHKVEPMLEPLRTLVHIFALTSTSGLIRTGAIWGSLNLLINVAIESERILSSLIDILEELSHNLGLLALYPVADSHMEQILVEVFVDVILFCSHTTTFLRKHPIENLAFLGWSKNVGDDFTKLSARIEKKARWVKERAVAHDLQFRSAKNHTQIDAMQDLQEQQQNMSIGKHQPFKVKLPCHHIPFPRNRHFFGRELELKELHKSLDHDQTNPQHQALGIWGTGGTGKSQIALAYAHDRKEQKIPIVLWVNSETQLEIYQSFTSIAFDLGLEGAVPGSDSNNVVLVTSWLLSTTEQWLMIYDNVVHLDVIQDCWAKSHSGSVLLTSRYDIVAFDPVAKSLQIPFFTKEQGSELLLKAIGRGTTSSDEVESAEKLSEQLGGLALALIVMAMQIRGKDMQVKNFLPFYEAYAPKIHQSANVSLKPYYNRSLKTAWSLSFSSLDDQTTRLFSVFCFSAPDDIPVALLRSSGRLIVSQLKFCEDGWLFQNALEALSKSCLIRLEAASEMVYVHRVIQQEFRNTMTDGQRRENFHIVSKLLLQAFPKFANGISLRNSWPMCKAYIHHVIYLGKLFEEFHFQPEYPKEFEEFLQCLAAAGWYLHETGSSTECLQLLGTAYKACGEKNSLLYSILTNTAAVIEMKRNHNEEAIRLYEETKAIRESVLAPDHEELANIYNNISMALMSESRYKEAENYLHDALSIDLQKPTESKNKILHLRYMNLGQLYMLMKKFVKAREQIAIGRRYVIKQFGENSYYIATCERTIATIDMLEGSLQEARKGFTCAYTILTKVYKFHPTISATTYRLGAVELLDSKVEDAVKWLRQTLSVAQYNVSSKGDKGDVARASRKLAEALFAKGEAAEAEELYRVAEFTRKEIQGARYQQLGDNDNSYDLLVAAQFR